MTAPRWWPAIDAVRRAAPPGLRWMVVGSAAACLHGAAGIEPGDVDILVHPDTPDELAHRLADGLADWVTPGPGSHDLSGFRSTAGVPLLHDGDWLLGRWWVDRVKLEVARIVTAADGPVETMGREVWGHVRVLDLDGPVPVVPLEVQWATLVLRGQTDRMAAVRSLHLPWDKSLAHRALEARGLRA